MNLQDHDNIREKYYYYQTKNKTLLPFLAIIFAISFVSYMMIGILTQQPFSALEFFKVFAIAVLGANLTLGGVALGYHFCVKEDYSTNSL